MARWVRSPGSVPALVLAVTVLLGGALTFLAWRLFQQERTLQAERVRERLEQAVDRASAGLVNALARESGRLDELLRLPEGALQQAAAQSAPARDDALLVVMSPRRVWAYPASHLIYLPAVDLAPGAPSDLFVPAETAEFQARDHAKAVALLTPLAASPDASIRAGALLRIARNQRNAGDIDAALAAYRRLEQCGSTGVSGLPAELVARHARCELLGLRNSAEEQRREAAALAAALEQGRWLLSRGAWQFYASEADRMAGTQARGNSRAIALAEAATALWKQWQATRAGDGPPGGQRSVWVESRPFVLMWRSDPERMVARILGARYIEREWLGPTAGGSARLGIADGEGRRVVALPAGSRTALRAFAVPQLQWTLEAAMGTDAALDDFAARRNLLAGGLALALLFAMLGSYVIARAVHRELAVARLQSEFVAAVSHEFRSPLTTMQQLSEMLATGRVPGEDRRQRYYEVIVRETSRLRHLVEDLLDFGRMEAGAQVYRLRPLDCGHLIARAVTEFQLQAESAGYTVALENTAGPVAVNADSEALYRAVWNLLDNAVKYSPECKTIRVKLQSEPRFVAIAVEDSGIGIAPAEQERIFRKFVRGGAATAASIRGTGLGLAMVRHIVAAHGGEIRVNSTPGVGSTFTIVLPATEEAGQAAAALPQSEGA